MACVRGSIYPFLSLLQYKLGATRVISRSYLYLGTLGILTPPFPYLACDESMCVISPFACNLES